MNIQGVRIVANLHLLPLVSLGIVLGNAWLKGLGRVVHDYHSMNMKFMLEAKKRIWTALEFEDVKAHEATMFEKLCTGVAHCFAIVVTQSNVDHVIERMDKEGKQDELAQLPEEVKNVLKKHQDVLKVPTTLPTFKPSDHSIALVD